MDGYVFQFNNATYPITLPVVEPIENQNDPASYVLSRYFVSLINEYMTPSFLTEGTSVGLFNQSDYTFNGAAVGDFVNNPLNPTLLVSTDYTFPLCSLYREKEEFHQISLVREGTLSHFAFQYVLPPLSQAQYNAMYSFLSVLSKTILKFGFQGSDPLQPSGVAVPFTTPDLLNSAAFLANAGISFTTWVGSTYAPIVAMDAAGNGIYYPSITIRFQAFEQEQFYAGNYEPIGGIDIIVDGYNDGYSIADGYNNLALGSINSPISITSFSPSSGSKAGGQWIAINGAGFLGLQTGLSTLIADVPVTQQLIRSDNLMLVQTGTSLQPVLGTIQLTDILGTQYFSSTNYSYL
jgi:hypothetical protein